MQTDSGQDWRDAIRDIAWHSVREAASARAKIAERLSTLGSVVLGLSFLSLQLEDPEFVGAIVTAWVLLSICVIFGATITWLDWVHVQSEADRNSKAFVSMTRARAVGGVATSPDDRAAVEQEVKNFLKLMRPSTQVRRRSKWMERGRTAGVGLMWLCFVLGIGLLLAFGSKNI